MALLWWEWRERDLAEENEQVWKPRLVPSSRFWGYNRVQKIKCPVLVIWRLGLNEQLAF